MFAAIKAWLGSNKVAESGRAKRPAFRPRLESLEGRLVPATLTVTTSADYPGVAGTLRYELNLANRDAARGRSDTIVFASYLRGATVTLSRGPLEVAPAAPSGSIAIDGGHVVDLSGGN